MSRLEELQDVFQAEIIINRAMLELDANTEKEGLGLVGRVFTRLQERFTEILKAEL